MKSPNPRKLPNPTRPPRTNQNPRDRGKKEAAKPADKKAPAPPPGKKPFADLKALAALPDASAPDANQPKVLGSVYIPTGELCFVKLRGGAKASKGAAAVRDEERPRRLGRQGVGDLRARIGGHRNDRCPDGRSTTSRSWFFPGTRTRKLNPCRHTCAIVRSAWRARANRR